MTKRLLGAVLATILLCSSPPVQAKLVEVWGSGLVGGGMGGGNSNKDFYRWVRGGAAGLEAGAKLLFISAFIDYLRWFGGDANANLISINLGGDGTVDLTDHTALVLRLAGAYYHGTLPSDATIKMDNVSVTQVNTRGVGIHGGLGLRYTFAKVFSVGVTPEIGWHYFFGGAESSILDDNSSGWDFNMFAYFRLGLGI